MAAASDECEVAPPEGPEPPPTSPTRRVLLVGTPPRLLLPQSGGGGPAPPPGPPGRAPAERSAGSQPLRSAGHELASQVRGANASGRLWSFEGAGASAPSRAPLPPLAGGADAGSQSARGPQDRRTSCQLVLQLPDSARGMPFSRVVHAAHGQRPLRSTWQSMHFDGLLKQRERAGEHLGAGRSSKWDALRRLTGRASPLSPPATLRGGLAGGPAEPPERTIVLRKSSVLDLLGADVERYERRAWQVRSLEEAGVIARWNRDNAGAAIEPGDVIVEGHNP
ncbi:unnamed protein product [Prorocentrum cordatum]|uniref:Uncharacterized protein n=1 Tax=Prorocentrum cordatum TaxID=2364126 RepID=A0ABN9WVZ3_9DINO|nr:unnamed protein product [Polarella glacialis]